MTKKLNPNLIKIVNMLSDGEYHDGSTMGNALNMTRSAVWKTIKKLQGYGIVIDSVKGKGYALQEPLALLDANKIKHQLGSEKLDISVYESLASTMDYSKYFKNVKSLKVVLTEQQTQGRGRLGRDWYSPFGKNIYLSFHYPFKKDVSELAGLSLVASLAVLKTMKNFGLKNKLFTKWPNDILYDNHKLSGSLIEMQAQSHGLCHVLIGIGINVNMLEDGDISQPWTSMRKILGESVDRNELCAKLFSNLISYLREFEKNGFAGYIDEWMAADYLKNKHIKLKNLNSIVAGQVTGVNQQGNLLLRLADGSVRTFATGDATILKESE